MVGAAAWLEERIESEYKQQTGYQEGQSSLFTLDPGAPEDLPDNLRGERWGFVQLPLSDLQGELALLQRVLASIPPLAQNVHHIDDDRILNGPKGKDNWRVLVSREMFKQMKDAQHDCWRLSIASWRSAQPDLWSYLDVIGPRQPWYCLGLRQGLPLSLEKPCANTAGLIHCNFIG